MLMGVCGLCVVTVSRLSSFLTSVVTIEVASRTVAFLDMLLDQVPTCMCWNFQQILHCHSVHSCTGMYTMLDRTT